MNHNKKLFKKYKILNLEKVKFRGTILMQSMILIFRVMYGMALIP